MKCPRCGELEVLRRRVGSKVLVVFGCMFSAYLPADKDDDELQRMLDEWERAGGMDEWLETPMMDCSSSPSTRA